MPTRKCTRCGKPHNLCLENTETGEVSEELGLCYSCLWKDFKPNYPTERVVLKNEDPEERH